MLVLVNSGASSCLTHQQHFMQLIIPSSLKHFLHWASRILLCSFPTLTTPILKFLYRIFLLCPSPQNIVGDQIQVPEIILSRIQVSGSKYHL